MKLSDQQIQKFQALHEERFGTRLSPEEARERGTRLVELVQSIYELGGAQTKRQPIKNGRKR